MRYSDAILLLNYSLLHLRIASAKNPGAVFDITEKTVRKSEGYLRLREFFTSLSDHKRSAFRRFMRMQIDGVRQLMNKAKETGEVFTYADIEIEVFDKASGERVPDAPTVQLETADKPEAAQ